MTLEALALGHFVIYDKLKWSKTLELLLLSIFPWFSILAFVVLKVLSEWITSCLALAFLPKISCLLNWNSEFIFLLVIDLVDLCDLCLI